jgi:ferredoxin
MSSLRYIENVVTLKLDAEKCIGCDMCVTVCPHRVLEVKDRKAQIADRDACIECGACAGNCPVAALTVKAGVGCASAIISSWLTGGEPSCDCSGSC